jgi:hypothetical protein
MEVGVLPPVAAGAVQQGSCIRDTVQQLPKVVDLRVAFYRICVPKQGSLDENVIDSLGNGEVFFLVAS